MGQWVSVLQYPQLLSDFPERFPNKSGRTAGGIHLGRGAVLSGSVVCGGIVLVPVGVFCLLVVLCSEVCVAGGNAGLILSGCS